MRVLVIQDHPRRAQSLSAGLEAAGCTWDVASDAAQALDLARARPYDAVLLCPTPDGQPANEICAALRGEGNRAPIVVLAVSPEPSDQVSALDAGADDYLIMPFHPEVFSARLRSLTRRRRL